MATRATKSILRQLRNLGFDLPGTDDDWAIRRTHAGHIQRSSGAWSWALEWVGEGADGHAWEIGSQWPAREIAAKGFTAYTNRFGQTCLDPKESP